MVELVQQASEQIGVRQACEALGLAPATFYRRIQPANTEPKRNVTVPKPRLSVRAITRAERERVIEVMHSERFRDEPVPQVYATLLDEGVYLCSMASMYRILRERGETSERRALKEHTPAKRPELLASAPNEVWSWDITKLKGPGRWNYFCLYVILDVFSRYAVGWTVEERESADLATDFIQEIAFRQGIAKGQLTIHADRGAAMTSRSVSQLMVELGIERSHSRPHVSNDNPFSESHFKTMKYRPEVPDRFASAEHAREVFSKLFDWYNECHRHSGIGFMTPSAVHFGRTAEITERRQHALRVAYNLHPERFVGGEPRAPVVPTEVWINKPLPSEEGQSKPDTPPNNPCGSLDRAASGDGEQSCGQESASQKSEERAGLARDARRMIA